MMKLDRDRIALVGMTQSGKSTYARVLFEHARCRRLLVDPKHSWRVDGVLPVDDVAAVDWRAPVIHFRPRWADRAQSDELYRAAFHHLRGSSLIWTDEAYGVSSSSWPAAGGGFVTIQTQGAELGIGHIVCTQRPVNAARETFTEADHVILFPPLDDDDLKTARQGAAFAPLEELRAHLAALEPHGYLHLDRRARAMRVGAPLPGRLVEPELVFRARGGD